MKNLFSMLLVILCCLVLTACVEKSDDDKQSDIAPQDQIETPDVPIEDELEEDTNEDAQQQPSEPEAPEDNEGNSESEVVIQNEAFQIFEPNPNEKVEKDIVVRGLARVFEGGFTYEFEDGHFIIDQGVITASEGAPAWGAFEFTISLDNAPDGIYKIVLYEKSAKDGKIVNELIIPIQVSK